MKPALIVAGKEWRDGWRNRWLLAITIVFALMSLGISWFGSVAMGQVGPSPLPATIASLSSLAVLVMPLIALLLGYDAFVGEQEQGTLLLLLSYPISKTQLVLGKFIGQAAILTCATVVGFGAAGLLLSFHAFHFEIIPAFLKFITSSVLLGWVFLATAHLISLIVTEKSQAAGLSLIVWFLFTLVYDLALLAILVGTEGWISPDFLKIALLINPTDVFRLINLISLDAQGSGVMASVSQMDLSIAGMFVILASWVTLIIFVTVCRFKFRTL